MAFRIARSRSSLGLLARSRASMSALSPRPFSAFADVPQGPPDAILGLVEAFNADTFPQKVSLSVGAYRDDEGKPYVLDSVKEAEKRNVNADMNKEYAGIVGVQGYVDKAIAFAYGADSAPLNEGRIAAVQTLSGTGACRLAGDFFSRFHIGTGGIIHQPNPTWGNHIPIFKDAGLAVEQYKYFDKATNGLDFSGLMDDVNAADDGSLFLLHACAHNPTGVDPTLEQWKELSALMKKKSHVAFFDCAYQGFASGDADVDAAALRHFVAEGHKIVLAQSFAKNFGLYGERVGALSVVCSSEAEKEAVLSQLKILVRPMYSNPPVNGARIVETILNDAQLEAQWRSECKGMADRIIDMRNLLKTNLESAGSTLPWNHITDQIGMFCYTGLSKDQVQRLRDDHHIYLTGDGRVSMAGVNKNNVDYVAGAIHEVTK